MRCEAHLRENEWVKDEWQSEQVFAILRSEWDELQTAEPGQPRAQRTRPSSLRGVLPVPRRRDPDGVAEGPGERDRQVALEARAAVGVAGGRSGSSCSPSSSSASSTRP